MLDIKTLLMKLTNAVKVDHIIEQGTSGVWEYRKWNSGFCELRVKYTTPRTSTNTNFKVTFPWTFATEPHVQLSGGATSNSASFARYANATTTSVDCYVDASSGSYVWAFIYVSGYLA